MGRVAQCSSAPALVSAASPWGAETGLSPSRQSFHLGLRCKFFWYQATSRAAVHCMGLYSLKNKLFLIPFIPLSLVRSLSPSLSLLSLFSSCWSILYVSWRLCFPCSHFALSLCHLFIQVSHGDRKYSCRLSQDFKMLIAYLLSFLLFWIPFIALWWIKIKK